MSTIRRSSPLRQSGVRSSDPFTNLSTEQLTYIGAIAMLYNDVEAQVNRMCGAGLRLPFREEEVLSRINGIEGKIEIIKEATKHWGLDQDQRNFIADSLGDDGFMLLKRWRDGVIHARVFDIRSSVAKYSGRRGKTEDVLLHIDALKGLYERLSALERELRLLTDILSRTTRIVRGEVDKQGREQPALENLDDWAQAQSHRNYRLSLPPLPEFPEDIPDFARMIELLNRHSNKPQ